MTNYNCPECDSTQFGQIVTQQESVKTNEEGEPLRVEKTGEVEIHIIECSQCGYMIKGDKENWCSKHDREKKHTGGNIYICPDCEREDMKENPEKYDDLNPPEAVERENRELLESIKEGDYDG